jgi:hypothetical protein
MRQEVYEIYCAECQRTLTSEEIDYWKKSKRPESQMICYFCLRERTKILKMDLPHTCVFFGRKDDEAVELPQTVSAEAKNENTLDLSKAKFLKEELSFDPTEPVIVTKTPNVLQGPFGTKAGSEKMTNTNINITKISAIGSNENTSLTLIIGKDVPPELVPFLENALNKFLASIINTIAFAPLHSSVMHQFYRGGIDGDFDPGNIRFPWNDDK